MHSGTRDVCKRYSEMCVVVVIRASSRNIDVDVPRSQGVDDGYKTL